MSEEYSLVVVHWIHVAQDRDQWRTLVNMIMTLWFENGCKFLTS